MIIAHRNESGLEQPLIDHLVNVAQYGEAKGKTVGLPNTMILISLLHDLGKADRNFQRYIRNPGKDRINHSSAGGKYIKECLARNCSKGQQPFVDLLVYTIYAHHGLFDVVNNAELIMEKRRSYDSNGDYYFNEDVLPFVNTIDEASGNKFHVSLQELFNNALTEYEVLISEMKNRIISQKTKREITKEQIKTSYAYFNHCLMRLCLSILKEGDIFDTVNVFSEEKIIRGVDSDFTWDNYVASVEKQAKNYKQNASKPIDYDRIQLSEEVTARSGTIQKGIYSLSLPTGSGKTQTALRFAINHAKQNNKQRVIYLTAFLSVLEQNAKEIKKTLSNSEFILEHHSNIIEDESENNDDTNLNHKQNLIDSWDSPVILSTMVQFFNTLFKGKASNIRRFHQLIESVIIIDEVQSLPVNVIYHFNLMMNFLHEVMGATVILCTATQPLLDLPDLEYPITFSNNENMVTLDYEMNRRFTRNTILPCFDLSSTAKQTTDDIVELVKSDLEKEMSILIVMNTKRSVKEIYQQLKTELSVNVIYLSTNMHAAHRLNVIEKIKEIIKLGEEKIVVISTQLIEAGVDLDFDLVYRALAGVDSIIQAAGRCNRNGRKKTGLVRVINHDKENLIYT